MKSVFWVLALVFSGVWLYAGNYVGSGGAPISGTGRTEYLLAGVSFNAGSAGAQNGYLTSPVPEAGTHRTALENKTKSRILNYLLIYFVITLLLALLCSLFKFKSGWHAVLITIGLMLIAIILLYVFFLPGIPGGRGPGQVP